MRVVDEHDTPPLRRTLGALLSASRTACIAITQLRLAGLDLQSSEVGQLESCRIMLGRVDVAALLDATSEPRSNGVPGDLLRRFAASGRLALRTAPHHVWNPDFSIFCSPAGERTVLIGAHYFGRPYPRFGLALTCILQDCLVARKCELRFEELWSAGYDVLPVVVDTLERLEPACG